MAPISEFVIIGELRLVNSALAMQSESLYYFFLKDVAALDPDSMSISFLSTKIKTLRPYKSVGPILHNQRTRGRAYKNTLLGPKILLNRHWVLFSTESNFSIVIPFEEIFEKRFQLGSYKMSNS